MSDNELDLELLAAAGDDSSDEEETKSIQEQSRSPSQDTARPVGRRSDATVRGVAQKAKRRGKGPASRNNRRRDESDEDGET